MQGNKDKLYYTKFNYQGLYQLDVKTGVESILIAGFPIAGFPIAGFPIAGFPISGWRHWQLRDNRIYYLKDKPYMTLSVETGEFQVMYSFNGRTPNSCHTVLITVFLLVKRLTQTSVMFGSFSYLINQY